MGFSIRPSIRTICLASMISLCAAGAQAHHSFAMFDPDKSITLSGTVKDFTWGNPHTWINVTTVDEGASKTWGIECGSPNMMIRQGWKSSLLKPGDRVSVVVHPMRDGTTTGSLVRITLADGRVLGPGGAPPPPQP